MKLRTQFLIILLLAFGSLSVLLILGRQRLSEAVADTEHIVEQEFNPLVLENAPRLQRTYEGLTGILNTIRNANDAHIAQLESNTLSGSDLEIRASIENALASLEEMEAEIRNVTDSLPSAFQQSWESHLPIIERWTNQERQIIAITRELSLDISRRAIFHEESEQTFIPFRASLDTLGERAESLLNSMQDGKRLHEAGNAISLILNADRDSYQALMGEQRIVYRTSTDPQLYETLLADYEENLAQISTRLNRAQALLPDSESIGFTIVLDQFAKWSDRSTAAVAITDKIQEKIRERETLIFQANRSFRQIQEWLSEAHSQLKDIAVQELEAFEAAGARALATSDNVRERARDYLALFNILAILAILCLIVLLIFQRRLVSNLLELSSYLSQLDEQKLSTPYAMPKQHLLPSLELSQLALNLNAMRERLVHIIQAHKGALKKLSRSESRFSSLFYSSVSPTLLADPNTGQIVDTNQAASDLYQQSIETLKHSSLSQLDVENSSTSERTANRIHDLKPQKRIQFRALQQKSDSTTFTAQVHAGLVEVDQTRLALITLNDVTERVEFERQLLLAKEDAEAANNAKDEFLSVISHELRTPLNPIIGYAQLLEADSPNDSVQQYSKAILASANRMLSTVDRILHFTELTRESSIVVAETFNLDTLLEDARSIAQFNAADERITFLTTISRDGFDPLPPQLELEGPFTNCVQILLNLIENAIKYSASSPIEVIVGIEKKQNLNLLHIQVADRGPGIPEHYRSRLFAPFTQADSSYTRPYDGLGLGLAISQKLAIQAGGEISCLDNEPQGIRFAVTIPVSIRESIPDLFSQSAELPGSGKQNKILLVEDNVENATYIKHVLNDLGLEVDYVIGGNQAIEKARNTRYSAALIDISMRDIDGLETLSRLNEISGYKDNTKSIAITAHGSSSLRSTCLAHGFHDFLIKPVTPAKLGETLTRYLA